MRKYVERTAQLWKQFQASHPEIAAELRGLVLGVCSEMTSQGRKRQLEAMIAGDEFMRLRTLALVHRQELGIENDSDQHLALWIRTICFCDIMTQERPR